MLREKKVHPQTLRRTSSFLRTLFHKCHNKEKFTLSTLTKEFQIASGTGAACIRQNIIKKIDAGFYQWIWPNELTSDEYTKLALLIKDQCLVMSKKSTHTPINPDWLPLMNAVKELTNVMNVGMVQQEKLLKEIKTLNSPNLKDVSGDLFRVDDQRLYIAGQIVSSVYYGLSSSPNTSNSYSLANDTVIAATDDLMKKRLNRDSEGTFEKKHKTVGFCDACGKEIKQGDEYYKILSKNKFFCAVDEPPTSREITIHKFPEI